MTIDLGLQ
jgi:hypothetical protein